MHCEIYVSRSDVILQSSCQPAAVNKHGLTCSQDAFVTSPKLNVLIQTVFMCCICSYAQRVLAIGGVSVRLSVACMLETNECWIIGTLHCSF